MTENKKIKNPGIVIEDKYAQLIRKRLKKEIISTENLHNFVGKELYLCGNYVYGSIILNEPLKLDYSLLASHNKRHMINEEDILKLWPDDNIFYAYSFRINKMFKSGIKYDNTNIKFGTIEDIIFLDKQDKEQAEMKKKEMQQVEKVEYYKSYEDKFEELKKLEFSEKYKSVAESFLALYELYLNKLLSKVYDGDGMVLKPAPDITENYIRIRIRNPKTIVEGTFRTIVISETEGIKAVIGKLKSDKTGPTHIQSVLFEKGRWTVERATQWVKDHRDSLKNMDYVKCAHCGKYFDYMAEKEAGMGYVKCPHCKENVDQTGKCVNNSHKKVEVQEKIETTKIWICPHCNKEIGEKEIYYNEKTKEWFHRPCLEKGPIELPKDEREFNFLNKSGSYIGSDYIDEDAGKGKQEPKWVWCKNCEKSFDYYKQLLDNKSTVLCPHCGALVIFEETE
jgi:DNA-directed RNA polymerase subunit RPC12/RpoP